MNTMKNWDAIIKEMKKKRTGTENVLIVELKDFNPTILSEKRKELLNVIKTKKIKSETQLAQLVKRQRENVVADLKLLEHYGLIERKRIGNKVVPKDINTNIVILNC